MTFGSCGFAFKKHIVGQYYLVGIDSKLDISLSFKLTNGDFVGRVPDRLIEYGYNDTFLIAKSIKYDKTDTTYYIIDMTKDSEFAQEESFRIGPVLQNEFDSTWGKRLKVKMISIE